MYIGFNSVSASGIWSLLGFGFQYLVFVRFYFPILGLFHGLWMGLRFRIIDFGYWYQFMGSNRYQLRFLVSASVLGLWIAFDRFQLPIVFGIQGSELSEVVFSVFLDVTIRRLSSSDI
ncbi:unnamed protein product [Rhizophagus irregularis]|nr:unnamed protein product [Rhizophagus irregularis]